MLTREEKTSPFDERYAYAYTCTGEATGLAQMPNKLRSEKAHGRAQHNTEWTFSIVNEQASTMGVVDHTHVDAKLRHQNHLPQLSPRTAVANDK